LHYLSFHFPTAQHHRACKEDDGDVWDRLLEEIISLITVKVAKTAPLEDLRSLRLCNKAIKRVSRAVTNRFNLEHHY
jgi:hypothetical protein